MDCKLVLLSSGAEESFMIRDGVAVVGRDTDNDIQLMSPSVSRHHAEVHNLPNVCELEDLSSANGTFVNGNRISVAKLQNGDEIQMGDCRLRFDECGEDSVEGSGQNYEYSERAEMDTIMIRRPPNETSKIDDQAPPLPTIASPLKPKE